MTNLTNIDQLSNLSEKEKEYALQILKEFSESGASDLFNTLKNADFKERPVDILTFILNDYYLGNAWHTSDGHSKLYPFWENELKKLFDKETFCRVNNIIISGARGLGKSEIAVAIICYFIYVVMCLKNPLEYFGLKPTEKICFAFMNITKGATEEIALSKFQKTIQLSPWFTSKGRLTTYKNEPYWEPPEPISIIIGSTPTDVRGKPILCAFFDEISFVRNKDIEKQKEIALDMIDTAIGGMKTRFITKGKNPCLLILASSKRSEKSFLEQHMKNSLKAQGSNLHIIDQAVWKVKPPGTYSKETFKIALGNKFLVSQIIPDNEDETIWIEKGYHILEVPESLKPEFIMDMERALCDFAGISSSEISKYINAQAFMECIDESIKNPFTKEIIEVGNSKEDTSQYYDYFDLSTIPKWLKAKPLWIHMDMSISGDRTGIAGTCIIGKQPSTDKENQSNDLFYQTLFGVAIKAPKGQQISFQKNRNFIIWLKEQGFNIKGISTDSFQSYDTGELLSQKGFNYTQISVDRVGSNLICIPYQNFKTTIYEKRLKVFKSQLLIKEVTDLERNLNNGRVDHPSQGSKDLSDAVCGSLYNASLHAEEYAYDYGESLQVMTDVALSTTSTEDKKQIEIDFENQMKDLFDPINNTLKKEPKIENSLNNQSQNSTFVDFGLGAATDAYVPNGFKDGILWW